MDGPHKPSLTQLLAALAASLARIAGSGSLRLHGEAAPTSSGGGRRASQILRSVTDR